MFLSPSSSSSSSGSSTDDVHECSYFNATQCPNGICPRDVVTCTSDITNSNPGQTNYCYTVWQNNSDGIVINLKGCLLSGDYGCAETSRCVDRTRVPKTGLYFCCCQENLCNKEFHHLPEEEVNDIAYSPPQATTSQISGSSSLWIWSYILIPILIAICLVFLFLWFRRHKPLRSSRFSEDEESVPITDQLNGGSNGINNGFKSIQLLENLSTGRFGSVWKARLPTEDGYTGERLVAVKIFPPHERTSWLAEQLVFQLPQFEHENILPFLGSEKRDDKCVPSNSGYWLITEYHQLGSLCDYLKSNTLDFNQLLKIYFGIARGLDHLHEEIPAIKGLPMKPSIAHRDFKSRNVLLRSDLTPRIADFGLCFTFYPDRPPVGLGQVGTRRYMAPEVLEGAINFSRDSLLRIDIYACALVLWEILSQCRGEDGSIIPKKYILPFELEVGHNPSLEDMQEAVCQAKKRPEIREIWLNYSSMKTICQTLEECWDQDAEARLTAGCVLERFTKLVKNRAGRGECIRT